MKIKLKVEYDNGDIAIAEINNQTSCVLQCAKCKVFQVDVLKTEDQLALIRAVADYNQHYEQCPTLSHEVES